MNASLDKNIFRAKSNRRIISDAKIYFSRCVKSDKEIVIDSIEGTF